MQYTSHQSPGYLFVAHITPLCNSGPKPERDLCESRFHFIIYHDKFRRIHVLGLDRLKGVIKHLTKNLNKLDCAVGTFIFFTKRHQRIRNWFIYVRHFQYFPALLHVIVLIDAYAINPEVSVKYLSPCPHTAKKWNVFSVTPNSMPLRIIAQDFSAAMPFSPFSLLGRPCARQRLARGLELRSTAVRLYLIISPSSGKILRSEVEDWPTRRRVV